MSSFREFDFLILKAKLETSEVSLFEEIEFFKDLEVNFITPLVITSIFVPSIIIQLLPFIIFISIFVIEEGTKTRSTDIKIVFLFIPTKQYI